MGREPPPAPLAITEHAAVQPPFRMPRQWIPGVPGPFIPIAPVPLPPGGNQAGGSNGGTRPPPRPAAASAGELAPHAEASDLDWGTFPELGAANPRKPNGDRKPGEARQKDPQAKVWANLFNGTDRGPPKKPTTAPTTAPTAARSGRRRRGLRANASGPRHPRRPLPRHLPAAGVVVVLLPGRGVPGTDRVVPRRRQDPGAIEGEPNCKDIVSVAFESLDKGTSLEVPQSHGLVPAPGGQPKPNV